MAGSIYDDGRIKRPTEIEDDGTGILAQLDKLFTTKKEVEATKAVLAAGENKTSPVAPPTQSTLTAPKKAYDEVLSSIGDMASEKSSVTTSERRSLFSVSENKKAAKREFRSDYELPDGTNMLDAYENMALTARDALAAAQREREAEPVKTFFFGDMFNQSAKDANTILQQLQLQGQAIDIVASQAPTVSQLFAAYQDSSVRNISTTVYNDPESKKADDYKKLVGGMLVGAAERGLLKGVTVSPENLSVLVDSFTEHYSGRLNEFSPMWEQNYDVTTSLLTGYDPSKSLSRTSRYSSITKELQNAEPGSVKYDSLKARQDAITRAFMNSQAPKNRDEQAQFLADWEALTEEERMTKLDDFTLQAMNMPQEHTNVSQFTKDGLVPTFVPIRELAGENPELFNDPDTVEWATNYLSNHKEQPARKFGEFTGNMLESMRIKYQSMKTSDPAKASVMRDSMIKSMQSIAKAQIEFAQKTAIVPLQFGNFRVPVDSAALGDPVPIDLLNPTQVGLFLEQQ